VARPVYAFLRVCLYALSVVRYTIQFTGSVQGVGFRYTTINVAQRFKVTGWVRNESDGSVKCVAEGEKDELDRFVAAVQHAMDGYISDTQITTSAATGEFRGFDVRR
jgi:acylphosphatase